MYKRERAGLEKNEIAFTLTNNSTLTSATINLFSLGTLTSGSNSGATTTAQQISVLNTSFSGTANWRFTYNTSLFEDVTDPTDIDDLITKLNVIFTENGQGIFWKEVQSASRWYLRVASSLYVFVNESHAASPTNTFTDITSGYISGTPISVSMGTGVTYTQVAEELTHQPYIITTVYVYCSTQSQITTPFSINKVDPNGASRTEPIKPQLLPTQVQNVQMAVPIYMTTSALNQLQYELEASAVVTMIVRYENIELFNALELLNSGEFQHQMEVLKVENQQEYRRIMNVVTGEDIIDKEFNLTPSYKVAQPKPKYFVVPLIFVVLKENGNKDVLML